MKKTLTVNLNGRVFNIDEDAFELLDNYLRNLRIYFRKEEGYAEIIADFEGRIEELLSERVRLGYEVITIEHVEMVIKQVGKPEDFGDAEDLETPTAEKSRNDGSYHQNFEGKKPKKRLFKDVDNKMLSGVCAGIAAYFGVDVTPIRLIFVLLLLIPYGWVIGIYLIMWIIVPAAKTAQQKLEMRGEEVSLENIGKVVASETVVTNNSNNEGCLGSMLNFIASLFKVVLVIVGVIVGLPLLFALVIVFIVLFAVVLGVGGGLVAIPIGFTRLGITSLSFTHPTLAMIAALVLIGIPVIFLIYAIVAHFAKLAPLPQSVKWTSIIVWIAALITLMCAGFHLDFKGNNIGWNNSKWHVTTSDSENRNTIEGNGELSDRTAVVSRFSILELDDDFIGNIQLEQSASDSCKILINGESNIIDKIKWNIEDNKLKFDIEDDYRLNPKSDILIKVTTPVIEGVKISSVGSVTASHKLQTDNFFVKIEGAGHFRADSLYCNQFDGEMEGLGNMELSGKTNTAKLQVKGAGLIKALDFEAKEVMASLQGVGTISSNPIEKIDAFVDGVGKITYKNEPPTKNIRLNGMGKIEKE